MTVRRLLRAPVIPPDLQRLADVEAETRLAADVAMTRYTEAGELVRLRERWIEANDALADAIAAQRA